MKTVAVLYLCTGAYRVFWKDFYPNFEQYFLPECAKTYFVFTDAPAIDHEGQPNVRRIEQEAYPWPYSTMRRFSIFLTQSEALQAFDYIVFANANLRCCQTVTAEEFLPQGGQTLLAVCHLPYYGHDPIFHPYDRNPKSRAWIPYNCGQYYVAGGLNGGTAGAYLAMCRELERRTEEDLGRGVIARCHDESQLNRLLAEEPETFRVLGPQYCVPEERPLPPGEEKIRILQKSRFIDIGAVKGTGRRLGFVRRKWEAFCENYLPYAWRLRDSLLGRHV